MLGWFGSFMPGSFWDLGFGFVGNKCRERNRAMIKNNNHYRREIEKNNNFKKIIKIQNTQVSSVQSSVINELHHTLSYSQLPILKSNTTIMASITSSPSNSQNSATKPQVLSLLPPSLSIYIRVHMNIIHTFIYIYFHIRAIWLFWLVIRV